MVIIITKSLLAITLPHFNNPVTFSYPPLPRIPAAPPAYIIQGGWNDDIRRPDVLCRIFMIYKWQHIITIMLSPYVVSIAGIKPDFNTFLLIFSHIGQKNFNVHNGPIIFFKKKLRVWRRLRCSVFGRRFRTNSAVSAHQKKHSFKKYKSAPIIEISMIRANLKHVFVL